MAEKLSHLDEKGKPKMVDISGKGDTEREAVAGGLVRMKAETLKLLMEGGLAKGDALGEEVIPPELIGPQDYTNLVICWGSTYHPVKEALERLGRDDTAMLHYRQVYPLHESTVDLLSAADRTIIVEGNATGQFANMISLYAGIDIDEGILKYNGLPFSVEETASHLNDSLSKDGD